MNISAPFIQRPVATTLLTVAIAIAGTIGYLVLPVSPLPQVDFPTISVNGSLPGASAEIMASSVATPLERQFGHIAGVTEMTSSSTLGATSITIQFDLSRNIDGAARDVEAAINAARTYLPANLPSNPTYRKVNPADAPIMILGLTSDKYGPDKMYDEASTVLQQKLSQIQGVGQANAGGGALPSVRVEVNPDKLASYGLALSNVQSVLSLQNTNLARGQISNGDQSRGGLSADHRGIPQRRGGAAVGCGGRDRLRAERAHGGLPERQARRECDYLPAAGRKHHRYGRSHSGADACAEGFDTARDRRNGRAESHDDDPRIGR
jgi:multidrug efflux pump